MTLRLTVNAQRWRALAATALFDHAPIIPVVKGNGYGFGRAELAGIAVELLTASGNDDAEPTIAIGTVHELVDLPAGIRQLVLTPMSVGDVTRLADRWRGDRQVVAVVASGADVAALGTWGGTVVIKVRSSMRRFGATHEEVADVIDRATAAGLTVAGAAIHLPLAGDDAQRSLEAADWIARLDSLLGDARELSVSHLGADALDTLRAANPGWSLPVRIGTGLWHGDKSALHLAARVLAVHPVSAGTPGGYHASAAPANGHLVIVGAGTAHGIAPLSDGRSPFHFARRRVDLLEGPHMHSSTLFVPDGDPLPAAGDFVDVQRPLIAVHPDEVVWS